MSKDYTLDDKTREAIVTFAEKLEGSPEGTAPALAQYISSLLPEDVKATLKDVHNAGDTPLLLLHNLPIDRDIPLDGLIDERVREKGLVSQRVLLAFSYLLGTVAIANPKEQGGKLIHDVAPVPELLHTRSSLGVEPLDPHTESPQEDNPPHYLMLLGLVGDPEANTVFIPIRKIFDYLELGTIEILKKPLYELRSGASYTGEQTINIRPIIQEREHQHILHYIRDDTRVIPQTVEAGTALEALKAAIGHAENEHAVIVNLRAGDAAIFNNGSLHNGVMHARAGRITDLHRWLERGFLYEEPATYIGRNTSFLTKSLTCIMADKAVPFRTAATLLRETMLGSDTVRSYKETHSDSTVSQAVLYGANPSKEKTPWLQRIATEAVISSARHR